MSLMMRSPRAKWLAGIAFVLVVGGAAAALWWPKQASGVVRGPGPYTREVSICQAGNFVTENRAGVQVTFLPDTVWHIMEPGDAVRVETTAYCSYYQRDFDQAFARDRNHEYYLALDHKFADSSKLFFSFEYYLQIRHAPPAAIPPLRKDRRRPPARSRPNWIRTRRFTARSRSRC